MRRKEVICDEPRRNPKRRGLEHLLVSAELSGKVPPKTGNYWIVLRVIFGDQIFKTGVIEVGGRVMDKRGLALTASWVKGV